MVDGRKLIFAYVIFGRRGFSDVQTLIFEQTVES